MLHTIAVVIKNRYSDFSEEETNETTAHLASDVEVTLVTIGYPALA